MTSLHLVRHGCPLPNPQLPASAWPPDPASSSAVTELRSAGVLPGTARWASSPEPKATATAALLTAAPVDVVDDLREAERPAGWRDPADFAAAVRRSLQQPEVAADDGWEPTLRTQQRVVAAVAAIVEASAGPVVLVGHGTAWTLLVAALTGQPPDFAAWQSLLMPDHCELTSAAGRRWRIAGSWGDWRANR